MADRIKLAENKFKIVPEGEDILLKITKAEARPKANPSVFEVTFEHESGATIKNPYKFTEEKGLMVFSFLARAILGNNVDDFSISEDLPKFVGKTLECEIAHIEGSKGGTFANIKKIIRMVEEPEAEVTEDEDDEL